MPRPRPPAPSAPAKLLLRPALAGGALAFALAEAALGLHLILALHWDRAEAALFFIPRPWLLAVAAMLAAGQGTRFRIALYAAALALASVTEGALLHGIGAANPWPELLRGVLGGAAVAAFADIVVQIARRAGGRIAGWLFGGAVLALFAVSPVLRLYEGVVLGDTAAVAASSDKPELVLMTALPIVWGEGGAFDPAGGPNLSYRLLGEQFAIRPIDALNPRTLGQSRLMLLAQPRALAPEELVALDQWVRDGGKVLILTDPQLVWPTALPLGDPRRPPPVGLLRPLLSHWGIGLEPGRNRYEDLALPPGRLRLLRPGALTALPPGCSVRSRILARCPIGAGEAIVIPDADLLHDSAWTGEGSAGWQRHLRRADNPAAVAALLDRLAGIARAPLLPPVAWIDARSPVDAPHVLGLAAGPLLAASAAWLLLLFPWWRKRRTNKLIHRDVHLEQPKNANQNGP